MSSSSLPIRESEVFGHKDWLDYRLDAGEVDYGADLQPIVDRFTELYAVTDENMMRRPSVPSDQLMTTRGIEVGHIFYFGSKYSGPMGLVLLMKPANNVMCIWGLTGLVFPVLLAGSLKPVMMIKALSGHNPLPVYAVIVNLKPGHDDCDRVSEQLYGQLQSAVMMCCWMIVQIARVQN